VPIVSKEQTPSDDVPGQMLTLLAELLRSKELLQTRGELAIGGAWVAVRDCLYNRPSLGPTAISLGLVDLAAGHLQEIGSPADMVSISRGKAGRGYLVLLGPWYVMRAFSGHNERPDLEAVAASGVFHMCVDVIAAVESAGVEGLEDVNYCVLGFALGVVLSCVHQPGCEAKIRSIASALGFCLENSLDIMTSMGRTTGGNAALIICKVFGRDEGGSEFTFTPFHIETLLEYWSAIVRAEGRRATQSASADSIFAVELTISDAWKPLLIANKNFIPYCVDALLLDPEHPRAGMKAELKAWCQQHHVEALAQLAVHDASREALLRDGSVVPALHVVAETGLSEAARELAAAALTALSDKKLEVATGGRKHVMLSYQWYHQATIKRVNASLIARGYATWFDLTNMKGSTMDAMSDAIEGADVMLYGVCIQYKESANVR
jgi:hypothetical protein